MLLRVFLLMFAAQPVLSGGGSGQPTDLTGILPATSWQWSADNIRERITFRPDGKIYNQGWESRGLVTSWQAIDQRTVQLFIEKGRETDRLAVLTFNAAATEFRGWNFSRGRRLNLCRKLPK